MSSSEGRGGGPKVFQEGKEQDKDKEKHREKQRERERGEGAEGEGEGEGGGEGKGEEEGEGEGEARTIYIPSTSIIVIVAIRRMEAWSGWAGRRRGPAATGRCRGVTVRVRRDRNAHSYTNGKEHGEPVGVVPYGVKVALAGTRFTVTFCICISSTSTSTILRRATGKEQGMRGGGEKERRRSGERGASSRVCNGTSLEKQTLHASARPVGAYVPGHGHQLCFEEHSSQIVLKYAPEVSDVPPCGNTRNK
jgi:hypothetical protein